MLHPLCTANLLTSHHGGIFLVSSLGWELIRGGDLIEWWGGGGIHRTIFLQKIE